jgi:quercetin dioxygenase-like cupin family protein
LQAKTKSLHGGDTDMTKHRSVVLFVCALLAVSSLAQTPPAKKGAGAMGGGPTMPGTETWMDIPAAAMVGTPSVDIGGTLKLAILQGDPMTAGRSYVVRLSCTDGAKIAPHWHPTTENVTVIKGAFLLGMGAKWDSAAMKELPVGAFVSAPPQMRHYAQCKGDTVVQVNGIGPLVINFVGPDDTGAPKKTN